MSATLIVNRLTGAGPTKTAVTGVITRAATKDEPDRDLALAKGVPVPTSGSRKSFWFVLRLEVTGGSFSEASNPEVYTDGINGFGTGVTVKMGKSPSYDQATGTEGSDGDDISTYSSISDVADAFSYTDASPLSLGAAALSGPGDFGDYCVVQITGVNTVLVALEIAESLTFRWSES